MTDSEITSARRSRGQLAVRAERATKKLVDLVNALRDPPSGPLPEAEIAKANIAADIATARLQAFTEAVERFQDLENMSEEEVSKDSFLVREESLEDEVMQARGYLVGLRSLVHGTSTMAAEATSPAPNEDSLGRPNQHYQSPRSFKFSALDPLEKDASLFTFKTWKETWEHNARIHRLSTFDREVQVYSLITAIGPHAARVVKSHFQIDLDADETTVGGIMEKLQNYYRSQRSVALDRVKFHTRKQLHSETFDQFRFALCDLADDAELCKQCQESQIVTQIMVGVRDEKTRHELLEERKFPTLQRAIEICHANEVASSNQASLAGSGVNKISSYKQNKKYLNTTKKSFNNSAPKAVQKGSELRSKCPNCGRTAHTKKDCPARDRNCSNCNRKGHFRIVCPSSEEKTNKPREEKPEENIPFQRRISSVFCGHIRTMGDPFCSLETISVKFRDSKSGVPLGVIQGVLPDTGAGANLMSVQHFDKLGQNVDDLVGVDDVLYAANNRPIAALGRVQFTIQYKDVTCQATFIVSNEFNGTLLNLQTSQTNPRQFS